MAINNRPIIKKYINDFGYTQGTGVADVYHTLGVLLNNYGYKSKWDKQTPIPKNKKREKPIGNPQI